MKDKLLFTALQWLLDDTENINQEQLDKLRAIKNGEKKSPNKKVTVALGIMTGKTDPECGEYSLYYSRKLFLDTYTSNTDIRRKAILHLLYTDKLEVVCMPEYKFDNHIGLKLKYKDEKD